MKNYTITERQKIYEQLLTLDCPDLLAALIAQRVDKSFVQNMGYNIKDERSLSKILCKSFEWCHTPEEYSFWRHIHDDCKNFEYSIPEVWIEPPTLSDVIESTEREMSDGTLFGGTVEQSRALIDSMSTPDIDFESPTDDWIVDDKKPLAKIYTSLPIKVVGFTPTEVTGAKIEIDVDASKFNQEMEKVNLTIPQPTRDGESLKEFWTKVKLFFGKWFYKV